MFGIGKRASRDDSVHTMVVTFTRGEKLFSQNIRYITLKGPYTHMALINDERIFGRDRNDLIAKVRTRLIRGW